MAKNKKIGQTTGQTDEPDVEDGIAVGATTAVTILSEEVISEGQQSQRLLIEISVRGMDTWIRKYPAARDNIKKGKFVNRNTSYTITADGMHTGEISAITEVGNAEVFVTVS